MQDIMPPVGANAQLVQSYGPGGFLIGNVQYVTHVLVTPSATVGWSGAFTLDAFAPLLESLPLPEVLLIGTGKRHTMLDATFRAALRERGLAVDSMDTGAACRTFNVLLGEGRRVAMAVQLPA